MKVLKAFETNGGIFMEVITGVYPFRRKRLISRCCFKSIWTNHKTYGWAYCDTGKKVNKRCGDLDYIFHSKILMGD